METENPRRRDAYELANLRPATKAVATGALAVGLALFLSAWLASLWGTTWTLSWLSLTTWGATLHELWRSEPGSFWLLFGAHVASLAITLPVTRSLFRRTPLPSLARTSVLAAAAALGLIDIASWLALPYSTLAATVLGGSVAALAVLVAGFAVYLTFVMWRRQRWPFAPERTKHVVIVGGGFAGLYAALGLDRALGYHRALRITVLDQKNYFLFPPLLPSVAAGAIETRQVTYPFRRLFEATNIHFRKEQVLSIDPERKLIRSSVDRAFDPADGRCKDRLAETPYDLLVLAPGATVNTFGTKGSENALFMNELADSIRVRNQVIDCFERAARETDASVVDELLRFVIVGGGPTGVELAAELRDLVDHVLAARYPEVDPLSVEVVLVQAADQILPGWESAVVRVATERLARIRVKLLLDARVSEIRPRRVLIGDDTWLATRTTIWCAGVKPPALLGNCGLELDRSGRARVDTDCRAVGHPEIFVLGDAAHFVDPATDRPLPPLGQVAFQQGSHTAKNLVRLLRGAPTIPFRYRRLGQLVSVGARYAAVDLFGLRFAGGVAWFIWRTLYLMKLVGFGNKVRVVLDWTLDLLIERSFSEIHTHRVETRTADYVS